MSFGARKKQADDEQPGAPGPTPVPGFPGVVRLVRGGILFAEGDSSRAMYLIKRGALRLFKKKGDTSIELDTVHSGQILGELAFLDGNPRSASAEALVDSEFIEISGPAFQDTLSKMPDWLKILLKTVVSRLRAASNKIRQLETSSVAYEYNPQDGKSGPAKWTFINTNDILKSLSAVLLVAARKGGSDQSKLNVDVTQLHRYVNNIMGIPIAKITSVVDLLAQIGIVEQDDVTSKITLTDIDFLEKLLNYITDENLLEPAKRHDLTFRGFVVMGEIAKHLDRFKKNEATGVADVNIAEIIKLEQSVNGKDPFRLDEVTELVKVGFIGAINMKSGSEVLSAIKIDSYLVKYRIQQFLKAADALNEQKRKGNATGRKT